MNSSETVAAILKEITDHQKVIILRHQHPDPDALGSQLGLRDILKASFPEKEILVSGKPSNSLAWMGEMDEVSDQDFTDALVIITDTANKERIDDERYLKGQEVIKIDHHPNDDPYAKTNYVFPDCSSSSELLWQIVQESKGELTIDKAAAAHLYTGIIGDTGRFLFSNTTASTFACVSDLMKQDFSSSNISQKLSEITFDQGRLQGYLLEHLVIDQHGSAMAIIYLDTLKELNLNMDQVHVVVSVPGRLEEVRSWAIFVQKRDLSFRVHLRSKEVPINEIAKNHHGGGHELASGADAEDERELDQIYHELERAVESYKR